MIVLGRLSAVLKTVEYKPLMNVVKIVQNGPGDLEGYKASYNEPSIRIIFCRQWPGLIIGQRPGRIL